MTDPDTSQSTRTTRLMRIGIAVVLVLIAVSLAYQIRIGPMGLDGLDEQVERSIYSNVRAQIANDIRANNPGLPDAFIQDQINQGFNDYVNQPQIKEQIDAAVTQQAEAQREMFTNDDTGIQYMQDIDPYFWLYYAENVVETGQPGDSVQDGRQWDERQLAPQGRPVTSDHFHAYFVAGWHRVLGAFQDGISVVESMMWYPILVFSIIVVLTFLIGSTITNEWGGFFAALAISTLPGALNRTVFGRGDTDALVIAFPLLAIYLFMEAFAVKDLWAKITFASLAGFVVGLFSFAWGGWWYPLVFILTTIGVYLVYRLVTHWAPSASELIQDRSVQLVLAASALVALLAIPFAMLSLDMPVLIAVGVGLGAGIGVLLAASLVRFVMRPPMSESKLDERNTAFWNRTGVWHPIAFTGAFVIIASLSVLLVRKSLATLTGLLRVFSFGEIKAPTQSSIFPNVYTTVAELNPAQSLQQVYNALTGGVGYNLSTTQGFLALTVLFAIAAVLVLIGRRMIADHPVKGWLAYTSAVLFGFIGLAALFGAPNAQGVTVRAVSVGTILLGLALIGLLAATIGKQDEEGFDVRYGILLTVWVIATVYATLLGIRFVLLLTPAFAIAVGAGAGYLVKLGYDAFRESDGFVWRYGPAAGMTVLLLMLVFFMPGTQATPSGDQEFAVRGLYGQAYDLSRLDIPLVDDTWYELLTEARETTPENTIITSWWDFGHQFKYFANRPVTFDGTTQNTPTAHWVGKLLITRDEEESLGVLRMLACSNYFGFDRITENVTGEEFETLRIVNEITTMNESEAQAWLDENGYSEDASFVLEQTHCEPANNLVIASGDMVGKAGVWGHFGTWNFDRAAVYNDVRSSDMNRADTIALIEERLNMTYTQAFDAYTMLTSSSFEQANQWIAGYPGYLGQTNCQDAGNETLRCRAQFQQGSVDISIDTDEKRAYANLGEGRQALPFAMLDNGTFVVSDTDAPVTIGVALLPGNTAIISSSEHVGSVFQRMYYYNGAGLECYDAFKLQQWPRGGKINTFSANWSCAAALE